MPSPRQQIAAIDKQIDALRKAHRGEPDFRQRESDLFRQRGFLQIARDAADQNAFLRSAKPMAKPKKCPTCGARTLIARTSADRAVA